MKFPKYYIQHYSSEHRLSVVTQMYGKICFAHKGKLAHSCQSPPGWGYSIFPLLLCAHKTIKNPLTFHNDKDPKVGVGLPLFHVEDTGELEEEEERGVKRLVLPHTQRPHVNVAPSLALSLQVLKTAHKQTNTRFSY